MKTVYLLYGSDTIDYVPYLYGIFEKEDNADLQCYAMNNSLNKPVDYSYWVEKKGIADT